MPRRRGHRGTCVPSDIAVLVTSGEPAVTCRQPLAREGIPAVVAGSGSVLASWAAEQLRLLLSAMERPWDLGRVRAYALSWFVTWTAEEVATRRTTRTSPSLQDRLAAWSAELAVRPVAEVLASIWARDGSGGARARRARRRPERHRPRPPGGAPPRECPPRDGRAWPVSWPCWTTPRVRGGARGRRGRGGPADRVAGPGRADHDRLEGEGAGVPGRLRPHAVAVRRQR